MLMGAEIDLSAYFATDFASRSVVFVKGIQGMRSNDRMRAPSIVLWEQRGRLAPFLHVFAAHLACFGGAILIE